MQKYIIISLAAILLMFPSFGIAGETSITIYSKPGPGAVSPDYYRPLPGGGGGWAARDIPGYAIVKETRNIELEERKNNIRFSDVAALIDPTTVIFKSITDPKTHVLEQNYLFDLVSQQKLLERYIGQQISIEQVIGDSSEKYTGTLLSTDGGITLKTAKGKIMALNNYSNIHFPELPGGLITKPTLVWDVITEKPGKHIVETSYETKGMGWWADYNLTFSEGEDANKGFLDIGAWVSIINKSGASYGDAKLKLIAGDVNRASTGGRENIPYPRTATFARAAQEDGFEEKSFFEFHLYTLGRKTTIPENSTKQVELFPVAEKVPAEKALVYKGTHNSYPYSGYNNFDRNYGNQGNKKVNVYLNFKNSAENGLGVPLPAGRIRVSKRDDADNSLEFIGEDSIDHTAKDEDISIKLGDAFDVVGERKQLDFRTDQNRRWMSETFEISIRNHKEENVKVLIKETLSRAKNWRIVSATDKYDAEDAFNITFPVIVPEDGEKKIRYTAEYTW